MVNELIFDGSKLRESRRQIGKTQLEVAKTLGISPSAYGEMERNVINPSAVTLVRLCIYFKKPITEFFRNLPSKITV